MAYLPPVGWTDVATKHDLHALEERIDLRFEAFGHRLDGLEHRLQAGFQRDPRTTMLSVIVANAAIVSVIAAVTNLSDPGSFPGILIRERNPTSRVA